MTENTPENPDQIEEIENENYLVVEDDLPDPEHYQPRRRWAEKTVKGIVVGRGETRAIIELEQLKKLAALNCSYADMAKFFGVKENTLRDHFRGEVEKAREDTKNRLREAMLDNAIKKHNATMQIWLSKNLLGFSDNPQGAENTQPLPWNTDQEDE